MAERTPLYRRRPVPALGTVAAAQVDEELRRVEDFGISVELRLGAIDRDCPADDATLVYYDCAAGKYLPAGWTFDPDYQGSGFAALIADTDLVFNYDRVIAFLDSNGDILGGVGNPTIAQDAVILVGTADLDQWDNVATRRPLFMGGSEVWIDAGTSMRMQLPGVEAYQYGYDLQLASDGEAVLAVPNPPPDFSAEDSSADDGTVLISGTGTVPWTIFPDGSDTQPDKLEVIVPAGTTAGRVEIAVKIRVINTTSNRSGTITVGVGYDGNLPLADDQQTYIIPAAFSGALDLAVAYQMLVDPITDTPVTVWFTGSGDHSQFALETDTVDGNHSLDVRISYGGGGGGPGITDHQLLDNRDPDPPESAHLATSVAYDNTTHDLVAQNVQEALDERLSRLCVGGWSRVGSYSLGTVGSSFVNVRMDSHTPMDGNRQIIVGSQGDISPFYYPKHFVKMHASLFFSTNNPGRRYRLGFRNNLSAAGEAFAAVVEAASVEFSPTLGYCNLSGSFVCPVEDAFDWWAAIREVGASSSTITMITASVWLELEG